MSIENEDTAAKRVVRKNEKFNVPDQTEKEEAERYENAPVENLADDKEIKRRKQI
jgi:predicted extracellular nuclease